MFIYKNLSIYSCRCHLLRSANRVLSLESIASICSFHVYTTSELPSSIQVELWVEYKFLNGGFRRRLFCCGDSQSTTVLAHPAVGCNACFIPEPGSLFRRPHCFFKPPLYTELTTSLNSLPVAWHWQCTTKKIRKIKKWLDSKKHHKISFGCLFWFAKKYQDTAYV